MEKIYLLVIDSAYDCATDTTIYCYGTIEKAYENFNKCIDDFYQIDYLATASDTQIEKTTQCFSAWTDGEYCTDHFTVEIIEKPIL